MVKVIAPTFCGRLDMLSKELAETVQYVGFETQGESRVELIFKTSKFGFEFRLSTLVTGGNIDRLRLKYSELYLLFKELKYSHLN